MPLQPGQMLSHYRLVEKIGEGGMGVVWKATDSALDREVAIKILPPEFSEDANRLSRFEREAKLLASLNHPNIATIHGLHESEGIRFLAMELVGGEDLSQRLRRGPLALEDVLAVALEIARALEVAHDNGVIHRDLKPANIKVTPEGQVKVLDFGLAKAFQPEVGDPNLSQSPTLTGPLTEMGAILGTSAYMAPEQARGGPVDKRADIWAFGVVVWELLTGKQIFARSTVTDTLAAVVTVEPDWADLPKNTPLILKRVLRRCLQKDTKRRLHDIADARLEIEEAAAEPDHAESEMEQALSRTSVYQRMRAVWWMLPTAVGIGVVAAWMVWKFLAVPAGPPRTVTRLGLNMPPGVSMDADPLRPGVALSPDGRWLVFVATEEGTRKLFKRSLDKFDVTPIPGTDNARFAFFSPDGRWVGFWDDAEDRIKKVALGGGVPVVLCEAPNAWGASWGINRKIVFSPGNLSGLWQVAEAGGEPEPLLAPSPETGDATYLLPEFLPDGKAVLYTAWRGGFTAASAKIGVLDLASGETNVLLDNAASARYLSTGHLVFGRGGRAEIAPFDLETREVTGPSVPIPEPIFYHPGGKLHLAVSNTGTLAFVPGGGAPQRRLLYVDLQGNKVLASGSPRGYEYPRFSPDAQRLAVTISEFGEPAIWIVDRTAGLETRLAGKGRRQFPLWSPDGRKVAFALETEDPPASWSLFWQQVDASDPPEPLLMAREPGEWLWPYSWTPDGKTLVFGKWSAGISQDVYYVSLDNPDELHPLLTTEAEERRALLSPDGRWIAYASNETGRFAIYVQRFPEGGERHQISTGASEELVGWAPAGKKLYYVLEGRLMEVGITTAPRFRVDTPRVLFEVTYERADWYYPDLHLSADGEKFIMVVPDDKWGMATEVKVILNWFDELEKLAPTRR